MVVLRPVFTEKPTAFSFSYVIEIQAEIKPATSLGLFSLKHVVLSMEGRLTLTCKFKIKLL